MKINKCTPDRDKPVLEEPMNRIAASGQTQCGHGGECGCKCCVLQIVVPASRQTISRLEMVEGITCPCCTVYITIDRNRPIKATADECGIFRAENPYDLPVGEHVITACSCPDGCTACRIFYTDNTPPLTEPTIETPECGATIADPMPWIEGLATAGNSVRVCIAGYGCHTVPVDQYGEYHVNFGIQFPDGTYTVTATQIAPDGSESEDVTCLFTIETANFMVEPIAARMGRTFRTIDIDVLMSGTTGTATIYYLLLPPGSPSPTAAEIMNYTNTAALTDGTAATGRFTSPVTTTPTTYTWVLTGLDNPNAPAGTTGVIDGYRYDAYIYVVSGTETSGVLTFDHDAVMGMPFATGLGTPENPFTIRELTDAELQMYPDLLEGNALNRPGVDETARQLENIERLITLYEETDGYYGLGTSMELNYLMTSDIDLEGYAPAYDGEGWEAIGDVDGWINGRKQTEHKFSGVFDGGGHTIRDLSITPTASDDGISHIVLYRGLFGAVEGGTIKNLTLDEVTVDAFTTIPGYADIGSFISVASNPTLENLTLKNAVMNADCHTMTTGDTHQINMGGFFGEIYDGGTVSGLTGSDVNVEVPPLHARALGGVVGFTNKGEAYDSYEDIKLSGMYIEGDAMIGGFAGYVVYGANLIKGVKIRNAVLVTQTGDTGGLVGRYFVYGGSGSGLIEDCGITQTSIRLDGSGAEAFNIGGLIGEFKDNPFANDPQEDAAERVFGKRAVSPALSAAAVLPTTIRRCSVDGSEVEGFLNVGGLIGRFATSAMEDIITLCKTDATITAEGPAGGLVGASIRAIIDQSFSKGDVTVESINEYAGGVAGISDGSDIRDCYSASPCDSRDTSGGVVGRSIGSSVERSYHIGDVSAERNAGGIVGVSHSALTRNNIVLGGAITAPVSARRIVAAFAGATSLLIQNYALNTVTPPGTDDPNGSDGGTITPAQIIPTISALGWNTATVWDTSTVNTLGRPVLLNNPE